MKVHLLFEIEVPEVRNAKDDGIGVVIGQGMMRALRAIQEDKRLHGKLIRAEYVDVVDLPTTLKEVQS